MERVLLVGKSNLLCLIKQFANSSAFCKLMPTLVFMTPTLSANSNHRVQTKNPSQLLKTLPVLNVKNIFI